MNGVPLRRVSQAYVSGVKLPDRLTDDYFKREKKQRKRTEEMFEEAKEVLK